MQTSPFHLISFRYDLAAGMCMWFRVTWLCLEPEKVDVAMHYAGQSKTGRLSDPPFTKCSAHKLGYTEQLEVINYHSGIYWPLRATKRTSYERCNKSLGVCGPCMMGCFCCMFLGLGFHFMAMLSVWEEPPQPWTDNYELGKGVCHG